MNNNDKNFQILLSNIMDSDAEFIPLLSLDDEKKIDQEEIPEILSILPLRNTVLFPGVVIPITVGRDKSIKLVKDAYAGNKLIGVVSQKDVEIEDPKSDELNAIGTMAYIIKILQMPDGSTTVIIQGRRRIEIKKIVETEPYFKAEVTSYTEA